MNCRTLKSRWGGEEANRKVSLEKWGARGSLGQESMGEQAALLNFDHLNGTSAHIQNGRLMGTDCVRKEDSSWERSVSSMAVT